MSHDTAGHMISTVTVFIKILCRFPCAPYCLLVGRPWAPISMGADSTGAESILPFADVRADEGTGRKIAGIYSMIGISTFRFQNSGE